MWSYACHPVCFPKLNHVSADFPGVVRQALRRRYGSIPILYFQGFSGDTRPCAIRHAARTLGFKDYPAFARFTDEAWRNWSGSLASIVGEATTRPGRPLAGEMKSTRRSLSLSALGPDGADRVLTIQEFSFSPDLSLFGVSAELVSAFGDVLRRTRPSVDVIPVGCTDGVPCYIPTSDMISQGGYEVEGFKKLFGVTGNYADDVSQRVESMIFAKA